jgi:hypothetical protein
MEPINLMLRYAIIAALTLRMSRVGRHAHLFSGSFVGATHATPYLWWVQRMLNPNRIHVEHGILLCGFIYFCVSHMVTTFHSLCKNARSSRHHMVKVTKHIRQNSHSKHT